MRPKLEITRLKARIAVLEGQLAAAGLTAAAATRPHPEALSWAGGLTRQQAALMGALIGAWPRPLDACQIDEILPHHDHAADRDLKLAASVVNAVRRKLGAAAIETVWGCGYRAGPAFRPG